MGLMLTIRGECVNAVCPHSAIPSTSTWKNVVRRCANRTLIYFIIHAPSNRLYTVARYFGRFRQTGGPGCTERFIHTMDLFFIAVAKQANDRAEGRVPDLESDITVRQV